MPRRESSTEMFFSIGLAWLAYWPFGCAAGFFLSRGNEFTWFHVRQGAMVTTLWLAVLLVGLLSKGLALCFAWVLGVCMIGGMVSALQGRCFCLPGIARLAGLEAAGESL